MDKEIQRMSVAIAAFDDRLFYGHPISKFGGDTGNVIPEMKYHTSWDWLMPVVEKIEAIKVGSRKIDVCISGQGAWMTLSRLPNDERSSRLLITETWNIDYFKVDNEVPTPKIIGVFCAVYEFIEWYNKLESKAA